MIQSVIDNLKTIGACVSALVACAGGYVYFDGPVPASRQYVIAEAQAIKKDLIDNRLQINTVQRSLLRKEKFDRELDLQKVQEQNVRSILHQRIEQIGDELDNVDRERDELVKEKRKQ